MSDWLLKVSISCSKNDHASALGYRSQFATRGRLTSDELVIQRLQNWLIDKYRAEDERADTKVRSLAEVS